MRRSNSLYNSPIFCVPKKQGQGLRIVQDFRELNNHTHTDKYSMKEIHECIGDIGRSNSGDTKTSREIRFRENETGETGETPILQDWFCIRIGNCIWEILPNKLKTKPKQ